MAQYIEQSTPSSPLHVDKDTTTDLYQVIGLLTLKSPSSSVFYTLCNVLLIYNCNYMPFMISSLWFNYHDFFTNFTFKL